MDLKEESEDADIFEPAEEEAGKERLIFRSDSAVSTTGELDRVKPLFVHLTASIQNERVYQSVPDIPLCLCK